MKLRNKKTGKIKELVCLQIIEKRKGKYDIFNAYKSISQLNEEWEDVKEVGLKTKCYLINEETGYIATFDNKQERDMFMCEIDGWKPVKVFIDGEKYSIKRL